jgi:hypothetical protein
MEVAAQATLVRLVPTWTNPNGCLAGHRLPTEIKRTTDVEESRCGEAAELRREAFCYLTVTGLMGVRHNASSVRATVVRG